MKKTQSLKQTLFFFIIALSSMMILYYFMLFQNLKQQQKNKTQAIFEYLLEDALSHQSNEQTDLDRIKQYPFLKNVSYQLILTTPSGQTIIKEHHAKNQSGKSRIRLPHWERYDGMSHYQIDDYHLQGWISLENGHQLYVNLVHAPMVINWSAPQFWLPIVLMIFWLSLGLLYLLRHRNNWEKIIAYTNQISSQPQEKYQPLPLKNKDIGQEFLRLGYALSRLNYQVYKDHRRIWVLMQRLHRMVDNAPLPMLIINRNGKINFFNHKFEQMFMISFKRNTSYYLTDFVTGIDKSTHQILDKVSNQRIAKTLLVNHLQSHCTLQLHILPWFGEHGQIQGITGILNDITTLTNEIKQSQIQLQKQQNRLADFDRLWSVLGHELRTPLSGMIGMLELIDTDNLSQEQKETFATLQQTSDTMLHLLNDMLDVAKMDAGKLNISVKKTDILKLCQQVCDLMVGNARRQGIELLYFFNPNAPRFINTDEARLRQVLMNLIGNAIKFTKTGFVALIVDLIDKNDDRIKSAFSNLHPSPLNTVNTDAEDASKWLCFSIKDTGIGIKPEEQKKLFSYFNQANDNISRQFGGTGLGLAISNNFTKMMGGRIHLQSKLYNGSVFSACFPYKENHYQPVYQFNMDLSGLCLIVFTSQGISAKFLRELFDYLSLPAIVRSGINENAIHNINQQLTKNLPLTIKPIIMVEYELYHRHDMEILTQINGYRNIPKLLLSMMPERGISPMILEQYEGYLSKPLEIRALLSELIRLSQPNYKKSTKNTSLSHAQQSFNQFLSHLNQSTSPTANTAATEVTHEQEANQQTPTQPETDKQESLTETATQVFAQPLILVAEDNLMNQKVACKVLNKLGYQSIIANNGQEAIDTLQQHRQEIRLILMDCRMPVMDGLTATRHIRSQHDSIPIIALTANDTDDDREACLKAGMDGFLAKPLKKDALETLLKRLILVN